MNQYKKLLSLLTAAALAAAAPVQVLAENPEFAHDEATWARLRDNVMEYDELQMLVEEYNPSYMNNLADYRNIDKEEDAEALRENLREGADNLYDQAEEAQDKADMLFDIANSLEGLSKEQINYTLGQMRINSVSSLAAAYSASAAAAARLQSNAMSQEISADSAYEDSEMKRVKYLKNQTGLVVSTQSMFDSYNQIKSGVAVIEKNLELMNRLYQSTKLRVSQGMATQTDVLTALKNYQSLQSTYTQTLSSLDSMRQQLCMMTGWSYDAQPEIKEVPAADVNRILFMNPEADKKQALDNNYDLKYNRLAYKNMAEGSTDKKNMERTIRNQEETIAASLKTLYNEILQKKTALELADAALATEAATMKATELKFQIGQASEIEYIQAQADFLGKQIDRQTADIDLFTAMEAYDWAMKGYMGNVG